MKNRVDADIKDIKGEDIDKNYNDYSKPKMVMISGHDSTSSSDEYFMLWALGHNITEYKFPKFANQIALEVTKKDDGKKKSSYSDYFVKGYFNDDLMFNATFDEFIQKIEAKVWSDEKISEYCGFEDRVYVINIDTDSSHKSSDKAKKAYKVFMSIFIVTTAILLTTTIFFAYQISQLKKNNNNFRPNEINISSEKI
jgi:hypothetical protein